MTTEESREVAKNRDFSFSANRRRRARRRNGRRVGRLFQRRNCQQPARFVQHKPRVAEGFETDVLPANEPVAVDEKCRMQGPLFKVIEGEKTLEDSKFRVGRQRKGKDARLVVFDRFRQPRVVVAADSEKRNPGLVELARERREGLKLFGTVQTFIAQIKDDDGRPRPILR